MNPVDLFLARRPYYTRAQVEYIALSIGRIVPFCLACSDWHYVDEPCSDIEER
jgi:hypothetical protein